MASNFAHTNREHETQPLTNRHYKLWLRSRDEKYYTSCYATIKAIGIDIDIDIVQICYEFGFSTTNKQT